MGELRADDIDEIAEGKIKPHCRTCGAKQIVYIRLQGFEIEDAKERLTGRRTHNTIGGCSDPSCWRFIKEKEVKSWVRKDSPVGVV